MADTLHPIVALWRTIGKDMTAAQFRTWYRDQSREERSQLAELAAEELGATLLDLEAEVAKTGSAE